MTPEDRATRLLVQMINTEPKPDARVSLEMIAAAIREAEVEAEQRAVDRCRHIISTAIIEGGDPEAMRRLLLAAFDPALDSSVFIIKPIPSSTEYPGP